jgi:two-component system chemotaxis response regulator CheY
VVDDFATMRRIIKGALKQIGFSSIIEADDGNSALRELKSQDFGLILSDWNMPNMTGIDLLKAAKSDESLKDIPFIMVTAAGQKDNVMEALQAGVSNYIMKPFTPQALEEKIKKVLD